jgi:dihydroxy-acid dehydratase
VKDGDIIRYDIPLRSLEVKISEEEIRNRLTKIRIPERAPMKYLRRYSRDVAAANLGAVIT